MSYCNSLRVKANLYIALCGRSIASIQSGLGDCLCERSSFSQSLPQVPSLAWGPVQVRAPTEFQGTVIGDLNRRKGVIQNSEAEGDDTVMNAQVCLGFRV